jgi:hypothetical protein
MPCPLCNSLQAVGPLLTEEEYRQHYGPPTRSFKHKGISRTEFVSSAEKCYCCRILLEGIDGCLQQHERDLDQVVSVSFVFLYSTWDGEIRDCDKKIECIFVDETEFTIEFFTLESTDVSVYHERALLKQFRRQLPLSRCVGRCFSWDKDIARNSLGRSLREGSQVA